jgi:anti-sigma regulatory factor (Ser/Thr protein kinase)
MSKSEQRTFPARFDSLSAIDQFVADAAERAGFDHCTVYQVQLAVDEACSNIIEHGYGGEGHGTIECSLHVSTAELTIVLRDYGDPFDPQSVPEPDVEASLAERTGGGLGLYFIRHIMDDVHFEFDREEGNRLTMVKRSERLAPSERGDECQGT